MVKWASYHNNVTNLLHFHFHKHFIVCIKLVTLLWYIMIHVQQNIKLCKLYCTKCSYAYVRICDSACRLKRHSYSENGERRLSVVAEYRQTPSDDRWSRHAICHTRQARCPDIVSKVWVTWSRWNVLPHKRARALKHAHIHTHTHTRTHNISRAALSMAWPLVLYLWRRTHFRQIFLIQVNLFYCT
jgi:hypothetical protein